MTKKTQGRVAIVTDSTAYPPPKLAEELNINNVALQVSLGGQSWRDGVDISPAEFYALLKKSKEFPITSQPNISTFEAMFCELSRDYDGIVAVLVSAGISGTWESAQLAAANLPHTPIEIIDSGGTATMLTFPVLAAARAAAAGADLETVAGVARQVASKTHLYFAVDTFEYLHRGGRIGLVGRLLGSSLNIKPIIQFKSGVTDPVTKVRTMHKAVDTMFELVAGQVGRGDRLHLGVFHIDASEKAAYLRDRLRRRFEPVELIETDCSPVLGAHSGPGTVGVGFYVE